MEKSLTEAAKKGDVEKLHDLIEGDPFLLRAANLAEGDNPLHIACLGGHVDFAKQVLNLRPDFAQELNPEGFSPLHIASAGGDIEIVKELLKLGGFLCLVKGKEKRIPLHYAVAKGRIKVVGLLMSASLDSVKQVTARGESCFHLAVKNNQFDTFKVLCEHIVSDNECILNMKDEQGNTILHLAASRKIYEVVDLLLEDKFDHKDKLEVNPLNKNGLTPLDVLISEGGGDHDIEEMLRLSGAVRNQEIHAPQQNPLAEGPADDNQLEQEQRRRRRRPKSALRELQDYFKYDMTKDSPGIARNTLLVISVLITTATYQAVLSPPGGVWQDFPPGANNTTTTVGGSLFIQPLHGQTPGISVMGTRNPGMYGMFLLLNSFGFFMSLQMMYILTYGFPLQFELWLALFALGLTYDTCMAALAPGGLISTFFFALSVAMPAVMALLSRVRNCKRGRRRQTELHSTRESV